MMKHEKTSHTTIEKAKEIILAQGGIIRTHEFIQGPFTGSVMETSLNRYPGAFIIFPKMDLFLIRIWLQ